MNHWEENTLKNNTSVREYLYSLQQQNHRKKKGKYFLLRFKQTLTTAIRWEANLDNGFFPQGCEWIISDFWMIC